MYFGIETPSPYGLAISKSEQLSASFPYPEHLFSL